MPRKKPAPEKQKAHAPPPGSPRDLYQKEKARRASKRPTVEGRDLLAEAEAEFKALLEAEALAGRGGRPKKMVNERAKARAKRAAGAAAMQPTEDEE